MADYRLMIPFLIKWEGGWSWDADDRALAPVRAELETLNRDPEIRAITGGKLVHTNKGITWSTWKHAATLGLRLGGYRAFLTANDATVGLIFKQLYWDVVRGDEIEVQEVANVLSDFAWGSGPGNAIRTVQRVLNKDFGKRLRIDGTIARPPARSETLDAINKAGRNLVGPLVEARAAFLRSLLGADSSQQKYARGWFARVYEQLPEWAKKLLPQPRG